MISTLGLPKFITLFCNLINTIWYAISRLYTSKDTLLETNLKQSSWKIRSNLHGKITSHTTTLNNLIFGHVLWPFLAFERGAVHYFQVVDGNHNVLKVQKNVLTQQMCCMSCYSGFLINPLTNQKNWLYFLNHPIDIQGLWNCSTLGLDQFCFSTFQKEYQNIFLSHYQILS